MSFNRELWLEAPVTCGGNFEKLLHFHSTMAVQRNASLKNERNLEKNYEDIIFLGIIQTEWKNT